MNSRENGEPEVSRELTGTQQQLLQLLEDILDGGIEPSQKRRKLMDYCRDHELEESRMWANLALYKQHGPAGAAMFCAEHVSLFGDKQRKLRTRIVELIGKLPQRTVDDFRSLLDFRRHFLDRIEHVSDLLVYFFLEREKGLWRESWDTSVYTTYFNYKLFRELNAINEIVGASAGIRKTHIEYENWLLDQALDEEAPV